MGTDTHHWRAGATPFVTLWFVPGAQAEDSEELAKKALNPVAAMYSLPVQYNWDQKMGPAGDGMRSVTNILLGSEQWGIGPTAVALKQENGWTHGILANHC